MRSGAGLCELRFAGTLAGAAGGDGGILNRSAAFGNGRSTWLEGELVRKVGSCDWEVFIRRRGYDSV